MPVNEYDELLTGTLSTDRERPYDALIHAQQDQQRGTLKASVRQAQTTSPDAKAKAMQIADRLKMPVELVERNPDLFQKRDAAERIPYEDLIAQSPNLAKLLEDPHEAAVAHDDLEQLGLLEWITTAPQRAFQQAIEQDRVSRLRTKELFGDLTREERDQLDASKFYMQQGGNLGAGDSWFRNAVTGGAKLLVNVGSGFGRGVGQGVQYAGTAAAFGLTATAATSGAAAPAAAAFVPAAFAAGTVKGALDYGFQLEAGLAFDEFLDVKDELGRPLDRDVAKGAAIAAGAINSGLEAFGLAILAKTIPGVDKLTGATTRAAVKKALRVPTIRAALADAVKTYGKTLTAETSTEVAQRAVTILAGELGKAASGQPVQYKTPGEVATDLGQEAIGALEGFAFMAVPGVSLQGARDVQAARQASHSKAFFEAMGQGITDSKTFQRSPQTVERLVERAAEQGPVPNVYAPVETWVEYWQSKNEDPAKMAAEVTGHADALAEAEQTGADLVIPTSRYAVTLAGTEHNAFFANELRLAPDAMNAREEDEFRAEQETAAQAQATAAPAAKTSTEQLREALTEQLVEGGKFDDRTAEAYADLATRAFGTMAADAGLDPFDVFQRRGLQIRRPDLGYTPPDAQTPRTEAGERRPNDGGERGEPDAARADETASDESGTHRRRLPSLLDINVADAEAGAFKRADADTSFDPSEFEQRLFDDLKEALTVDTLDTGEQQPRLPGAEDVRDQNVQTPEMEAPFALTSPVAKAEKLRAQVGPSAEYLAALEESRVASRAFTEATRKYRAREIDDETFIAAKKQHDVAAAAFDQAAEAEERRGKKAGRTTLFQDYYGLHRPPGPKDGAPAHDLTGEGRIYPDDVYSRDGARLYGTGDAALDRQTFRILAALKGKPDATLTIYRAVPVDVDQQGINPGDWVTVNRKYAEDHGLRFADEGGEGEAFRIIEKTVKASEIFTNGDSIHEWGYWPDGKTLAQTRRGNIQFGDGQTIINLFAAADPSTVLHEFGHLFLDVMGELATEIGKTAEADRTDGQRRLLTNYDAALAHIGAENRQGVGVAQQERFASLFEQYLREGKAPSEALREVFSRFRAWMLGVYRLLKDLVDNQHADARAVRLSPEVREVFDRMLATDDEIAAAQRRAHMQALFLTPDQAMMTPEQFALYTSAIEKAHRTATEELDTKLQAEVRREQTAQWKERRTVIRADVAEQMYRVPVYQALWAIRRGTTPDGQPFAEPMKLSRAIIADRYGADRLKALPPFLSVKEGGLDPDMVGELFGFPSGDALLEAITTAEPMHRAIEQETDRRMVAEHGSLLLSGEVSLAAQEAVANEDREIVLREELKALAALRRLVAPFVAQAKRETAAPLKAQRDGARSRVRVLEAARRSGAAIIRGALPPKEAVKAAAVEFVAKSRIRDLQPSVYWSAMRRAADKAVEAAARQDFDEAIAQKTLELVNLARYREAEQARADVAARVKKAQSLEKPAAQQRLGKIGHGYLEQINGVLERFGLSTAVDTSGRSPMRDWMEALEADGNPVDELPEEVRSDGRRQDYRTLSYEEFVGVTDGITQLEHLAREHGRLKKASDERDFAIVRDRVADSIREHGRLKPLPTEFGPREERRRGIADWFASHAKIATLARIMDGGQDNGAFWSAFIRPLNAAADEEGVRKRQAYADISTLIEEHYPGRELARLKDKTEVPGVGSLSREARLVVALHWGNETSRQRLLADPRRRWSRGQVEAILDSLSETDLAFVNAAWTYLNTFWPEIAAKQKRITGIEPQKVEAIPFTVRGVEMSGGYAPLIYDARLNARAQQNEAATEAKLATAAAYVRQTTKRGHVEARKRSVQLSVRLELDAVLFGHVDQVIHDLTHHEALLDATKLLRDKRVQEAIYDTRGDIVYQQFTRALQSIAVGTAAQTNRMDKAATFLRTGTQIAMLGWNLWTAAQQPLGLFNGASRVGGVWVMRGLKTWLRSAKSMEGSLQWINERSKFMRERNSSVTQDVADLSQQLRKPGGWFDEMVRKVSSDHLTQQHIADSMLWHIGMMQKVADVPTWLGQYEKSMAEGVDEDTAVALADQAVIDSQGSGRIVDLSQIQRGGPVARLFLTFYTYGATVYNSTLERVEATDFKSPAQVTSFLGHLSLLYVMPAVATVMLANLLGKRDDDDVDEWLLAMAGESLSTALNTMAFVRELTGLTDGVRGWAGPAGARFAELFYRTVNQMKQGEVDEALLKAMNQTAGVLFRYPAAQVERTIDGAVALMDGTTHNPAALLVGPPKESK